MFDFSNLENLPELSAETKKKALGNFKLETPVSLDIDEIAALGAKAYASTSKNKKES